jgi:acetyl esterase/lipase
MKKEIYLPSIQHVACLASEIVYAQRTEWCDSKYRQLKLSLMKPRNHYPYDEQKDYPLIVWICGGSFTEVDRNVWMPELSYFVKRGYAVASVEYSITSLSKFPDQLIDVKEAIRFLKAHAKEFHIQSEHIAVMGESAGGYLSGFLGLTGSSKEFDKGGYLDFSSKVNTSVVLYPVTDMKNNSKFDNLKDSLPKDVLNYPSLMDYVTKNASSFLLFHGLEDNLVDYSQSELLYNALQKVNVYSDLYLFKGANHADHSFFQPKSKEIILNFLNKTI